MCCSAVPSRYFVDEDNGVAPLFLDMLDHAPNECAFPVILDSSTLGVARLACWHPHLPQGVKAPHSGALQWPDVILSELDLCIEHELGRNREGAKSFDRRRSAPKQAIQAGVTSVTDRARHRIVLRLERGRLCANGVGRQQRLVDACDRDLEFYFVCRMRN
jgi:hypothetical protein